MKEHDYLKLQWLLQTLSLDSELVVSYHIWQMKETLVLGYQSLYIEEIDSEQDCWMEQDRWYYRNHTLWIQWTIESILLTGAFTKSDERANPESSLDIRKEKERDEIDWRAWCYQLFNSYYVEISGRGIEEERELGLLSSLSNYSMSLVVILVVLFFTILSSKTMKMGLTALSKDNLVLNIVEWDQ